MKWLEIPMNFHLTAVWAFVSLTVSSSCGQASVDSLTIFSGRNVYSPALEYDEPSGYLKMWYGGWQSQSDYPHDKIYYRTSKDGVNWSEPLTVLTSKQLPVANAHVNDPSVVKTLNKVTNRFQYTMFYTVCIGRCVQNAENQIWTSVSSDGLTWKFHKPLVKTNGAAVPSAIAFKGNSLSVWRIFYSNTAENNNKPTHVFMAEVDGDRNVLRKDVVAYTHQGPGVIANPDVRSVDGTWNLLFNVYHTRPRAKRNTADVYLTQSDSPSHWRPGSAWPLIVNDPTREICASVAPTLASFRGRLLIQFGEARYTKAGTCDFSIFGRMQQLSVGKEWLTAQRPR